MIYQSYLAGQKEPRFASVWFHDPDYGGLWDITLGGRVGVLRYGTMKNGRPEGWQLDMEGAAFPRLDLEDDRRELVAADFRFGVPLTYGVGRYQTKFAYYHISSHLGDEYMLRYPGVRRINYTRDAVVWGNSYDWTDAVRVYGEAAFAFHQDGGAEPWELQVGLDYSPQWPSGLRGTPFAAMNVHLLEELDFDGFVTVQSGWQWRGENGRLFRVGGHYLTGKSPQFEFFDADEEQLGFGIWFDY